jgi:hypothetical protein
MTIALIGSVGAGFVWGWLMGEFSSKAYRIQRLIVSLGIATVLYALSVLWLAGWKAVVLFVGATALALLLHLGWQGQLISRFKCFS